MGQGGLYGVGTKILWKVIHKIGLVDYLLVNFLEKCLSK